MTKSIALKTSPGWLLGLAGLVGALWFAVAHGAGENPLPMFNAEYNIKRNGIIMGTSTRSLSLNQDGTYLYASSTQATGLISWFVKDRIDEHSKWTFDGAQIRPLEYVYDRYGGRKPHHVKLSFDWQRLTVTNTIDGEPWHMDIPPDAQDKLVYQLAIMADLLNGKKDLSYKIADGGKLKEYAFEIKGEEVINTALGRLKTVRIQRIGDSRDTTVWCAPQFSYLPVRLEQQDTDGSELTMQLNSARGLDKR